MFLKLRHYPITPLKPRPDRKNRYTKVRNSDCFWLDRRYKLNTIPDAATDTFANSLVGVALSVPDVVDGGSGVYP